MLEAAAVGIPDDRLGELVAAVVSLKPAYHNQVSEASLLALTRERFCSTGVSESMMLKPRLRLPRFAVPVIIIVQNEPLGENLVETFRVSSGHNVFETEHTPSGKIMKEQLRRLARDRWKQRHEPKQPRANL